MKQTTTARILIVAGLILLSANFISYMMGKPFIAVAMLPVGIILLVTGAVLYKKHSKNA